MTEELRRSGLGGSPSSYREVFRVPGVRLIIGSLFLGRLARRMWTVALVLFVLATFHSAAIAGATVALNEGPGLLISPFVGALLDRRSRRQLVVVDYCVSASSGLLIVALHRSGLLSPPVLLSIAAANSLTTPLSWSGLRSALPQVTPRSLWDRSNALDSGTGTFADVIGPAAAGVVVGAVGGAGALLATSAVFSAAAVPALFLRLPPVVRQRASLTREAVAGFVYVIRHRTLRGLVLSLAFFNLARGSVIVAFPVLVLTRLHKGPATVGALVAFQGAVAVVAVLVIGRLDSSGKERTRMAIGIVAYACGLVVLAVAPSIAAAAGALVVTGIAIACVENGLFALRQRRTHPDWFGRVFVVSSTFNYLGAPVGSVLGGYVLVRSIALTLMLAAGCAVASSVVLLIAVPRRSDGPTTH